MQFCPSLTSHKPHAAISQQLVPNCSSQRGSRTVLCQTTHNLRIMQRTLRIATLPTTGCGCAAVYYTQSPPARLKRLGLRRRPLCRRKPTPATPSSFCAYHAYSHRNSHGASSSAPDPSLLGNKKRGQRHVGVK